jgi:hypothetical protein
VTVLEDCERGDVGCTYSIRELWTLGFRMRISVPSALLLLLLLLLLLFF